MAKTTTTTTTKRTKNEVFGELMLDCTKLIFGGIVLAAIFDSNFNKLALVVGGLVLCVTTAAVGIQLITKK